MTLPSVTGAPPLVEEMTLSGSFVLELPSAVRWNFDLVAARPAVAAWTPWLCCIAITGTINTVPEVSRAYQEPFMEIPSLSGWNFELWYYPTYYR